VSLVTYLGYSLLFIFGHLRDFMRRTGLEKSKTASELKRMKVRAERRRRRPRGGKARRDSEYNTLAGCLPLLFFFFRQGSCLPLPSASLILHLAAAALQRR